MPKKITFYEPFGLHLQLFETALEIAQNHLDRGDQVEFVTCNGTLPICEINPNKSITTCTRCISRRNNGISLLSKKIRKIPLSSYYRGINRKKAHELRVNFNSLDDLKAYKINSFKIGAGVYSSILDQAKNHKPNIKMYKDKIEKFLLASFYIYESFNNYIKIYRPSTVYLFNGRHSTGKPIITACKENNIEFFTYEFHYYFNEYKLYKNTQPHDYRYEVKVANKLWKDASYNPDLRESIGASFYNNTGVNTSLSRNYNASQVQGKIPQNWDSSKHNIVFFTSSEFESYAAFEYKEESLYENHFDGITKILDSLQSFNHNIHIYIRLHPHLASVKKSHHEVNQYYNLKYNFLTIIAPDDDVDTYSLIKNASKVISYFSTAAIEAAFNLKPTILLSKHFVAFMGSCYLPKTHEEVISLLSDINLSPKNIQGALKFGYFFKKFGVKYRHYNNTSLGIGKFKYTKVDVSPFIENFLLRNFHRKKIRTIRKYAEKLFQKLCVFYIKGLNKF